MDLSHGIFDEPKVSSIEGKKQVAIAAMSQIKGAKAAIEKYFDRGNLKIPYSFPTKPAVDLEIHHNVGEGGTYM